MKNYINKPDILKWYIYKILLIMRLTTVILMVSMLQVSASTVAQEFNYVKKGASLIQIFKEIKKQTGYNIIWNEKKIDVTTTIDANFKKATIHDVLNKCLSNLPLSYSINDKMVMIKEAEPSFRKKLADFFNSIDVRGRVVDENNQPLVGVTVKVKGSSISTATNFNGEFLLRNLDENAVLVISFIGYQSKEIKSAKTLGDIQLIQSTGKLEEVEINTGYYTVTDRERTGSISRITSKEIEKQPINNPIMALVGRIPGIQITQQTGVPGGGFTVQIRGRSSINASVGNDPLYIIDNVIFPSMTISGNSMGEIFGGVGKAGSGANPLSGINPNDIESIEVLKDADATAIYGSKGANGVILITTKHGVAGATRVNASFTQGYSEVGHKLDLLNTEEYLSMREEAFKNDGLTPSSTDYDVNGIYELNKYTDWQDVIIGGKAKTTNASVNITGGNVNSNYLIAGSYFEEGTVFPGDFGLKRVGIRSNINISTPNDRFNAILSGNFTNLNQNLIKTDMTSYIFLAPNAPDPYNEYGKLNFNNNTFVNPFLLLFQPNDATTKTLIGNVNLRYLIIKNLVFRASFGYSYILRDAFLKSPIGNLPPLFGSTSFNRTSRFSDNNNTSLNIEPQIDYKANIGNGTLDALLGMSFQNNNTQFRTIQGANYSSDELMNDIAGAATITNLQMDYSQYKYTAIYSRLGYSMLNRYLINLTARRDGSSRFGSDRQFANFGAIGAAWIFSNESLFKDKLSFLSLGKLRTSYGVTGNDQIGNYGYLQLWSSTPTYQGNTTVTPGNRAPNPDFAWEKNVKSEFALQLGFLDDRLNFEVAYFHNVSSNQLLDNLLPLSTGLQSVYANSPGKVRNTGWEFESTFKIISDKRLHWLTSFNLSIPKNKLLAYPGLSLSSRAINYEIGYPLSILKVSNVMVDSQTGLYKIEDSDGDGVTRFDNGDRYLIKFMGQSFYGGLQNSIRYKEFNLDFHFTFTKQKGNDYRNSLNNSPGSFSFVDQVTNQLKDVPNRWQQPGDESSIQRFGTTSLTRSAYSAIRGLSNISIVDASFIRLRNISLSYTFPQNWLSTIKLSSAAVSIQGQNIFTLTKYLGLDPETQATSSLPPLRTLSIGLNVTF